MLSLVVLCSALSLHCLASEQQPLRNNCYVLLCAVCCNALLSSVLPALLLLHALSVLCLCCCVLHLCCCYLLVYYILSSATCSWVLRVLLHPAASLYVTLCYTMLLSVEPGGITMMFFMCLTAVLQRGCYVLCLAEHCSVLCRLAAPSLSQNARAFILTIQ